jgi:spoIIIJ-associated protein
MSETGQNYRADQADQADHADHADPADHADHADQAEPADQAVPADHAEVAGQRGDDAEPDGVADGVDDGVDEDAAGGAGVAQVEESPDDDRDRSAGDIPRGDPSLAARLEREGDVAADYLEELLDIADLDGDLDMDVEGERAVVSIVGADLQQLVGDEGKVLDALQELTRLAVYRETGERSRLMLDISGYRAARRRELEGLAATTVAQVKSSGERSALHPMTPFERKVVHDAVAAAGLTSESEGVEPRRYVVVLPA